MNDRKHWNEYSNLFEIYNKFYIQNFFSNSKPKKSNHKKSTRKPKSEGTNNIKNIQTIEDLKDNGRKINQNFKEQRNSKIMTDSPICRPKRPKIESPSVPDRQELLDQEDNYLNYDDDNLNKIKSFDLNSQYTTYNNQIKNEVDSYQKNIPDEESVSDISDRSFQNLVELNSGKSSDTEANLKDNEEVEEVINFGEVRLNGKKLKLFEVKNKRKFVEKIFEEIQNQKAFPEAECAIDIDSNNRPEVENEGRNGLKEQNPENKKTAEKDKLKKSSKISKSNTTSNNANPKLKSNFNSSKNTNFNLNSNSQELKPSHSSHELFNFNFLSNNNFKPNLENNFNKTVTDSNGLFITNKNNTPSGSSKIFGNDNSNAEVTITEKSNIFRQISKVNSQSDLKFNKKNSHEPKEVPSTVNSTNNVTSTFSSTFNNLLLGLDNDKFKIDENSEYEANSVFTGDLDRRFNNNSFNSSENSCYGLSSNYSATQNALGPYTNPNDILNMLISKLNMEG